MWTLNAPSRVKAALSVDRAHPKCVDVAILRIPSVVFDRLERDMTSEGKDVGTIALLELLRKP